jgi:hypothetical protein
MELLLQEFGGTYVDKSTARFYGPSEGESYWNFGYIPPEERTPEQSAFDLSAKMDMPRFQLSGSWNDDEETVGLWDAAKVANNGKHFLAFWQQTGSCVGNGGGQVVWYTSAVEVVRLGDPEQVILPFYLLPYGKSREIGGLRGRGSGSFGSAFAKAIQRDGILPFNHPGLPQPKMHDSEGITWGSSVELEWSDGARIPESFLVESRKYPIKTVANIRSTDEAWEAASNYYGMTIASNWGGQMKCPGVDGVLLNTRSGTWMHQMAVLGRKRHSRLGKLWYVKNSWGPGVHGLDPAGGPPGGFWINERDMADIVRQGECFAFSQFQGFPAQSFKWSRTI